MKYSGHPQRPGDRVEPASHHHGYLFRAKIVPFTGPNEYGEWFASESEVRAAMQLVRRNIGNRYYCETKIMTCAECEADQKPHVICTL